MPRLSALSIKGLKAAGRYADGGGLYLQVRGESKSWIFRYVFGGARREMGLGGIDAVSLADARTRAAELRATIAEGRDPIEKRTQDRAEIALQAAKDLTFRECALEFIEKQKSGWTGKRQVAQWKSAFETHAFPALGDLRVSQITRDQIIRVLDPLWTTKTVTAVRIQNRTERVLDYATVRGYRSGDNPARWKGGLDLIFPAPGKVARSSHIPAMPYKDVPAFFKEHLGKEGVTECALEFLLLTLARTTEVLSATWSQIDWEERAWNIPRMTMKAKDAAHRVPLTDAAVDVLARMRAISRNSYIFPGRIAGRPISNMSMLMYLRRLGLEACPHGYRSTFKDWSREIRSYDDDLSEAQLAHKIKNKVKAAYARGTMFERRRAMLEDWAKYCTSIQSSEEDLPRVAGPSLPAPSASSP